VFPLGSAGQAPHPLATFLAREFFAALSSEYSKRSSRKAEHCGSVEGTNPCHPSLNEGSGLFEYSQEPQIPRVLRNDKQYSLFSRMWSDVLRNRSLRFCISRHRSQNILQIVYAADIAGAGVQRGDP
jgi:hypothetical protein